MSRAGIKKIKIAVIAHSCRAGGAAVGAINLIKAFKPVTQNEEFMLIYSAGYGYEEIELTPNSKHFVYKGGHSPPERYWFERITLPKAVRRYNPDVIFGIGNIGLTRPRFPQALLIQQAYLFYEKKYYSNIHWMQRLRIAALKSQIRSSLPGTSLIFCQTPIVKRKFSDKFSYPENQINILRWTTPAEIRPAVALEAPAIFDKSSENFYILILTRYMPHRNPDILISLCENYSKDIREKQIKFITTVEAQDDPHAGRFLKEVSNRHLKDIIINVGRLSREEVLRYYSHSHVLWLPTTLETLCLPFLEAMKMGVPILSPDLDFARYVCGDAAIFYDPWDIKSIFDSIISIREDASLRQKLIEKGKAELGDRSKFAENWEEVAENVIRYLRQLLRQN